VVCESFLFSCFFFRFVFLGGFGLRVGGRADGNVAIIHHLNPSAWARVQNLQCALGVSLSDREMHADRRTDADGQRYRQLEKVTITSKTRRADADRQSQAEPDRQSL